MDSSSDSDRDILKGNCLDDSDIDTQILAEQNMAQAQETINDLKRQNTILKAQFEQAVIITKQIDTVHEKNAQLSNQIRSLQLDNENLQRRLEISLRHNEELQNQLTNEKQALAHHVSTASSEKELEVNKVQKQCNTKIDTLQLQIRKLECSKEQCELQNKMMNSKVERLMQAANEYFQLNFDCIDSFADYLLQPVDLHAVNEQVQTMPENVEVDEKKSKADKKKIKVLKKHLQKYMSEVNKLKSQLSSVESRRQQDLKNYQNEIQQLKDDFNISNTENIETVRNLNAKIQALKQDNTKLRRNTVNFIEPNSPKPSKSSPVSSPVTPIKINHFNDSDALREQNDSLSNENNELTRKVRNFDSIRNDLLLKLKDAENENTKLQLTIKRLEGEKQAAVVVQNETLNELKILRERVKANEEKKPKHELKIIERLKEEINRLENTNKQQTDQIHSLHIQSENDRHERASIQAKLRAAQDDLEEMQSKVMSLNDELAEAHDKLSQKPELKIEDIMPDSAFRCKDFDPKLAQKIEKVIENQYLAPQSKLGRIYQAILKFFNNLLEEKAASERHMAEHLEIIRQKINKFFVELSIGLSFEACTFDDVVERDQGQKLVTKAIESYKGFEELKRKNAQLNGIVSQISAEFGPNVDIRTQISNIRQYMESLKAKTKEANKKLTQMKKNNKYGKKLSSAKISQLEREKGELTDTVNNLQSTIDTLNLTNRDLKKELQLTRTELNTMRSSLEQSEEDIRDEHQTEIQSMKQKYQSEKEKLKSQIQRMRDEHHQAQTILSEKEATYGKLRKMIDKHQMELREKEEEFDNYKREKESELANLTSKFESEKAQMTNTFEKAIAEIRQQCEDQRLDFARINNELKEQKEKAVQNINCAAKFKRDKQKLERDIKALEEQLRRDQMISEASVKNQIITIEENYSQQLQDAKAKLASEKRRIFSIAAEEFKKYYNPSEPLDERTYKALLNRIKKEFDRLTESDTIIRRLTHAEPRQATHEAVAKIITP